MTTTHKCGDVIDNCICYNSKVIDELKGKDKLLKKEIDDLVIKIFGTGIDKGEIFKRLDILDKCCEANTNANESNSSQIKEINNNITLLKGWNIKQDGAINKLRRTVVTDNIHLNFGNWVENVYLQNCDTNNYIVGDLYINVNPAVDAKNATYVYIKDPESDEPCSANDWQILYYSSPADVLSIIGIDPIVVTHPYKHERVIEINEDKLANLISNLKVLDLSKVEVRLGDIYTNPVYKDNVNIELNLNVGGETVVKNITVNQVANISNAIVQDLKVEHITNNNVTVDHTMNVNETLTVGDTVNTQHLNVGGHTTLNTVTFDGPLYIKPGCANPYDKPTDIRQGIFTPSFAKFVLVDGYSGTFGGARVNGLQMTWDANQDPQRTRLVWLGGSATGGPIIRGLKTKNQLGKLKPEKWNTPDIDQPIPGIIRINNSGVYNISYLYNIFNNKAIWANRAGLCLVSERSSMSFDLRDLFDSKFQGGEVGHTGQAISVTDHIYSTGDWTSLSEVKKTYLTLGTTVGVWCASGTTLVNIPCGERYYIIPYVKPSCFGTPSEYLTTARMKFTEGEWNTGSAGQISITKVGNSTTSTFN